MLTKQSKQPERLNRVVKCLFTPTEDQELRAMVSRLRMNPGSSSPCPTSCGPTSICCSTAKNKSPRNCAGPGFRTDQ